VAILLQIFSEHFVSPQSSEYFISIVAILEFLVKLIGPARIGNTTVEIYEADSEILIDHITIFELFMNYPSFWIV